MRATIVAVRGRGEGRGVAYSDKIEAAGVRGVVSDDGMHDDAARLAARLGVPLVPASSLAADDLSLRLGADGLSLAGCGMKLRADFSALLPRIRPGRLQRELLVRAAKVKLAAGTAPAAVDATAGLGKDAFLLAAAGFRVRLCERNPVVAALLADALRRAADDPALAGVAGRMEIAGGDGVSELRALAAPPDVVYLDPMFPARSKSAAVKKKFQLLHRLERPCSEREQEALLQAALAAAPRKVVVKRPPKEAPLAGAAPSYSLSGKAVRYDVFALARP